MDAASRTHLLETLARDPEFPTLVDRIATGYYAAEPSWTELGWSPAPTGGWPDTLTDAAGHGQSVADVVIPPSAVRPKYDVIVVGSGAGGGTAAAELARAGRRVLVIERGPAPTTAALASDHARNPRTGSGLLHPASHDEPRLFGDQELSPTDGRYGMNAATFGGGTRLYGAQTWRFSPEDFAMRSTYGEVGGLSDWPIGHDEMEPYYTRAEELYGVSGDEGQGLARSRPYPMAAFPFTAPARVLAAGAERLGIQTFAVPMAVNTASYAGRAACIQCAQCAGFACPVNARGSSSQVVLDAARVTGRIELLLDAQAVSIDVDATGEVVGVTVAIGDVTGGVNDGARRAILADEVVVSAGAVETARLLLASRSPRHPTGLGNARDQVGRYLQGHIYAITYGLFDQPINDYVGPGPSIATFAYRHHNEGIVGGGMIANDFVPTPINARAYLVGAGLMPTTGQAAKDALRELMPRLQRVLGPVQEIPVADSRIQLDVTRTDRHGMPLARLSGSHHPEDDRTSRFLEQRAVGWLAASGATRIVPMGERPHDIGPSAGQHQAGTARMGNDPASSVTDPLGRVWGHANLRVIDSSLHVTNGGVNPVLTIMANALRITDQWDA